MIRIPRTIFRTFFSRKGLCPSDLKVFLAMLSIAFASKGQIYVSYRRLTEITGLSPATVMAAVKRLVGAGLCRKITTQFGGRQHANRYRLSVQASSCQDYFLLSKHLLSEFESGKLAVYCAIVSHSNRNGKARPSLRRLSRELGVSLATVHKYCLTLEKEGYLQICRRAYRNTSARRSNEYDVALRKRETTFLLRDPAQATDRIRISHKRHQSPNRRHRLRKIFSTSVRYLTFLIRYVLPP